MPEPTRLPAARPASFPPRVFDRRQCRRLPPRSAEVFWHVLGHGDGEPLAAQVHDVSTRGIGLVLDRPVEPGAVLCVRLRPHDPAGRTLLVRVQSVQAVGPEEYKVGGTFIVPLLDDLLRSVSRSGPGGSGRP
jgi:hypothetical protein